MFGGGDVRKGVATLKHSSLLGWSTFQKFQFQKRKKQLLIYFLLPKKIKFSKVIVILTFFIVETLRFTSKSKWFSTENSFIIKNETNLIRRIKAFWACDYTFFFFEIQFCYRTLGWLWKIDVVILKLDLYNLVIVVFFCIFYQFMNFHTEFWNWTI